MNHSVLTDPTAAFDLAAPRRVVSLVPSVTASLFDLGLGGAVVGVTDYCTYLADNFSELVRVGGPKDARVSDIIALRPDLVIANREENSREGVEALAAAGIPVWVMFPTTVREAINDLWTMANLFRSDQAMKQVDWLEKAFEWAEFAAPNLPARRYFCPIWEDRLPSGKRWWMTFNAQTYSNDVLRLFNCENIFANRARRYPLAADLGNGEAEDPGERDVRYPRVVFDEIVGFAPEIIMLPDEPFAYDQAMCGDITLNFKETPAAQAGRVFTFDGTLITWYGTRLARALAELPALIGE